MYRFLSISCLAVISVFAASDTQLATRLYHQTDYAGALRALGNSPQTAQEFALSGKIHYQTGNYKQAAEAFEKSISLAPGNSEYFLWLGRAFGRRAETSSVFTAPGFAKKAKDAFETSVKLDPKNREALNDLFEYYIQAPGFLGGGFDKAEALVNLISKLDPAEQYFAKARLAEEKKEWAAAEQHLRRAAELAPKQVGRALDLAKFLARRGKITESEAAFRQAEKIAPESPQLLFDRAQTYIESKRNTDLAKVLLQQYLKSPLTPDNPSRAEAQKLLKQAGGE